MIHVLKTLANGSTCDYQPVGGGIVIIVGKRFESVDFGIFNELRKQGLIEQTGQTVNYHLVFHPSYNNPVCFYSITPKGRAFLGKTD